MVAPVVRAVAEQIHDALDAADAGYHDRKTGELDMTSDELAAALLASGWLPPASLLVERQKHSRDDGWRRRRVEAWAEEQPPAT
jgi:hypothetical protein